MKESKLPNPEADALASAQTIYCPYTDEDIPVIGILGGYLGMLSVPADTRTFPNSDEYRWGHFIALDKPIPIADSIWKLLHKIAKII